jgi:hypothetical protein
LMLLASAGITWLVLKRFLSSDMRLMREKLSALSSGLPLKSKAV